MRFQAETADFPLPQLLSRLPSPKLPVRPVLPKAPLAHAVTPRSRASGGAWYRSLLSQPAKHDLETALNLFNIAQLSITP